MQFIATNGDAYIVLHEGAYYHVTLDPDRCKRANPPNLPDQFLKAGYYEPVDDTKVPLEIKAKVARVLTGV